MRKKGIHLLLILNVVAVTLQAQRKTNVEYENWKREIEQEQSRWEVKLNWDYKKDFRTQLQQYYKDTSELSKALAYYPNPSDYVINDIFCKSLIETSGRHFYQFDNTSICKKALEYINTYIPFSDTLIPDTASFWEYFDDVSMIKDIWHFDLLTLHPKPGHAGLINKLDTLFDKYQARYRWEDSSFIPSARLKDHYLNQLLNDKLEGNERLQGYAFWFYSCLASDKDSTIAKYLDPFQYYIINDPLIPNGSKFEWYLFLAKLYATLDYSGYYQKVNRFLKTAQEYEGLGSDNQFLYPSSYFDTSIDYSHSKLESRSDTFVPDISNLMFEVESNTGDKYTDILNQVDSSHFWPIHTGYRLDHVEKGLLIRNLRAKSLLNFGNEMALNRTLDIFWKYYRDESDCMNEDQRMRTLVLFSRYMIYQRELHELQQNALPVYPDLFMYAAVYVPYFEKNISSYSSIARSNLWALYRWEKEYSKMCDLCKLPIRVSSEAYDEALLAEYYIAGLTVYQSSLLYEGDKKEYFNLVQAYSAYFFNDSTSSVYYQNIMEADSIETNLLAYSQYIFAKNNSAEFMKVDELENSILDSSFNDKVFLDNITLQNEKSKFYEFLIQKRAQKFRAEQKANQGQWKEAYNELNTDRVKEYLAFTNNNYALGYSDAWSSQEKEQYKLKQSGHQLEKRNQQLEEEGQMLKQNILEKQKYLQKTESQLLALEGQIGLKTRELKDSSDKLGEITQLSIKLRSQRNIAKIAEEKAKNAKVDAEKARDGERKQKIIAQGNAKESQFFMWIAILLSIPIAFLAIVAWRQRNRAKLLSLTNSQLAHIGKTLPARVLYAVQEQLPNHIYSQIRPHFRLMLRLGTFLDKLYSLSNKKSISVQDEIDLSKDMADLYCLGDQMPIPARERIELRTEISAESIKVPPFAILNLVHNSFRHGKIHLQEDMDAKTIVDIKEARASRHISILDSGRKAAFKKRTGTGKIFVRRITSNWNYFLFLFSWYVGKRKDKKEGYQIEFKLIKKTI